MHTLSLKRLLPRRRCPIASRDANFNRAEFEPTYNAHNTSVQTHVSHLCTRARRRRLGQTGERPLSRYIYIVTTEILDSVASVRLSRDFLRALLMKPSLLEEKSPILEVERRTRFSRHSSLNNDDCLFCPLFTHGRELVSPFTLLSVNVNATFFPY